MKKGCKFDKKKIEQLHKKYPFIDPTINLILGGVIGVCIEEAIEDILNNWRFWEAGSFWACIVVIAGTILYLAKFSNYSNTKKDRVAEAKEKFNETLIKTATKELSNSDLIDEMLRNARKVNRFIDKLEDKEGEK